MNADYIRRMLSEKSLEEALHLSIKAGGAGARVLLLALASSDDELHIKSKKDGTLVSDADYA
mgnify:FL=1